MARLGGGVVDVLAGAAEGGGGGGDVDDGAAVGHPPGGLLGAEHVPDEVDVDDLAQVVVVEVGEAGRSGWSTPALLTRPVSCPRSGGGVEQAYDLVGVGGVGGDGDAAAAGGVRRRAGPPWRRRVSRR